MSLTNVIGSSTVTVIALNPQTGHVNTAYLGDSVYKVYRHNVQGMTFKILEGQEKQHKFNCPYQVGVYGDNPSEASTNHITSLALLAHWPILLNITLMTLLTNHHSM